MNLRDELHGLAERLPEGATWDDVIEHAQFRKAVLEGIAQADRGEFANDEHMRRLFARFGIDSDRDDAVANKFGDEATLGLSMDERFDEIRTSSVKQQAMAFLDQLPADVTWGQLAHEFEVAACVAESVEENRIADPEQIAALLAKAGVRLAG